MATSWSSAAEATTAARALTDAYLAAGGQARVNRLGHFTMLIAQRGHTTEIAATDWLEPNPPSPTGADSSARIREVFDEPHTRKLLDALLAAVTPQSSQD